MSYLILSRQLNRLMKIYQSVPDNYPHMMRIVEMINAVNLQLQDLAANIGRSSKSTGNYKN